MNDDTILDVLYMVKEFKEVSPYSEASWDEDKVFKWLKSVMEADKTKVVVLVLLNEGKAVGCLCGLANELPFSTDIVCAEYFWWVKPEFRKSKGGLQLLEAYEYWAKNVVKAKACQMVSLNKLEQDKLGRLYKIKKYQKAEESYLKWL